MWQLERAMTVTLAVIILMILLITLSTKSTLKKIELYTLSRLCSYDPLLRIKSASSFFLSSWKTPICYLSAHRICSEVVVEQITYAGNHEEWRLYFCVATKLPSLYCQLGFLVCIFELDLIRSLLLQVMKREQRSLKCLFSVSVSVEGMPLIFTSSGYGFLDFSNNSLV